MRVTAIQYKACKGRLAASRRAVAALAARAAPGSDLVVLPEMCASGYLFLDRAAVLRCAEPPRGPLYAALAPVARAHRCWMVAGFVEDAAGALFNSALVIDPSGGLAGVYRKTLLFDADTTWARPGDTGYLRCDADRGAFGVGICMDLNDPAFVAWAARERLAAIAFPTNWLDEGLPIHGYWAARLAGTGATLVAANSWGWDTLAVAGRARVRTSGGMPLGTPFLGLSTIMTERRVLAVGPSRGDAIVRGVAVREPA